MRAAIAADAGRGPGHGIIEIFDAGPVTEPVFLLLRASDGKCLGPGGWQESETSLAPEAWDNDGGSLRLAVGPSVVDEVDNLDAYRLTLPGRGSCALEVRELAYSHMAGGHGMGSAPVQPAPEPEPEPQKVQVPHEDVPEPAAAPEEPLTMAENTEAKSGSRAWIVVVLLLLLAATGLAAWWFLLRDAGKPLPPLPNMEQQTPAPETAQQPETPQPPDNRQSEPQGNAQQPGEQQPDSQENTPQTSAPAASPTLPPLVSARAHLRGEARPEVSLGMARPLRKTDASQEESDAAFLLLEDAAQKGDAEAMLLVGQFYDPGAVLPRGSIPADLGQAKRWYEAALAKGHPQARAALDALKEQARALEARGDAEARVLLQHWN